MTTVNIGRIIGRLMVIHVHDGRKKYAMSQDLKQTAFSDEGQIEMILFPSCELLDKASCVMQMLCGTSDYKMQKTYSERRGVMGGGGAVIEDYEMIRTWHPQVFLNSHHLVFHLRFSKSALLKMKFSKAKRWSESGES
ncbi:hypothetical protein OIU85_015907 [Salix viminalis]|uniref:Uncharacterized protein n=1 Tax=Salix viminalis TaxID=40686 RepID=A0A9Q0V424_SALVM|nr:hypothetical protein OIU85_015907 [Salix viminalis]